MPSPTAVRVAEAALVVGVDAKATPGERGPGLGEGQAEITERVEPDHGGLRRAGGLPGDQRQPDAVGHHQNAFPDDDLSRLVQAVDALVAGGGARWSHHRVIGRHRVG